MHFIPSPSRNFAQRKLFFALLSLLTAFSMVIPAAAETTDVSSSATESKSQAVDVYATKAASFAVKLPVSITLEQSGGTGTANYSIFIKGDVEDNSSVTIEPQSTSISFKKTKGNTASSLSGTVTQAKTSVAAANITADYPATGQLGGSVSVSGLTAGFWKSQMVFLVNYTAPSGGGTGLHATALLDKAAMKTAAKTAPSITFSTKVAAPEGTSSSVDVSAAKDGSVMAHTLSDGSVVIGADGGVLAPDDMTSAFMSCSATSIDCTGLDTHNVTSMTGMFASRSNLTFLDVSSFDTSNVTSMRNMFSDCSNLTSLDLSNFDTSNVIDMNLMFANCKKLDIVNLNNFDTTNVKYTDKMFIDCSDLTIYVSNTIMETWVHSIESFSNTFTVIIGTPE